jgi:hypothetical protein
MTNVATSRDSGRERGSAVRAHTQRGEQRQAGLRERSRLGVQRQVHVERDHLHERCRAEPARRATSASGVSVFGEPASGAGSGQNELSVWLVLGFQAWLSVE